MSKWTQGVEHKDRIVENGVVFTHADTPEQAARIVRLLNEGEADKLRLDWMDERTKCDNIWNAVHFYPKAMAFTAANDGAKGSFANVREAIDAELALTEQTAQPDKPASTEPK